MTKASSVWYACSGIISFICTILNTIYIGVFMKEDSLFYPSIAFLLIYFSVLVISISFFDRSTPKAGLMVLSPIGIEMCLREGVFKYIYLIDLVFFYGAIAVLEFLNGIYYVGFDHFLRLCIIGNCINCFFKAARLVRYLVKHS